MSPEIVRNRTFDGYAIDLWALGPILFLMVTGFPPWERAIDTDQRFNYFANGYLQQTIQGWNLGLDPDLLDLLQRMFWRDPRMRLSLEQVREHPWVING
jgi:serine/threonine protein kinase